MIHSLYSFSDPDTPHADIKAYNDIILTHNVILYVTDSIRSESVHYCITSNSSSIVLW